MTPRFDVLVAGEINLDLVLSGNVEPEFGQVKKMVETTALTVGSSSAIFACGVARLGLKTAFKRAHRLGCSTSLDPNYGPSEQWQGFDELLPLINVFFPNGTEACSLTHQANTEKAGDWLSTRVETLVIKLGPDGALATRGSQKVMAPSIPIKFVDSVGAGDSFDAGFIYEYLNNWPLEKTLKLAIICGALFTQAAGGTIGQASMKDVESYDIG